MLILNVMSVYFDTFGVNSCSDDSVPTNEALSYKKVTFWFASRKEEWKSVFKVTFRHEVYIDKTPVS